MKTLIVYDSLYGNTKHVAEAIGEGIAGAQVLTVDEADLADLKTYDLVIAGAPTQAGRPSPAMAAYLGRIPAGGLNGVAVTAFDTRISAADCGPIARLAIKIFGFAAGRIGSALQAKGGKLVAPPEGFEVKDKEGPLVEGEVERAREWARSLLTAGAATER
jgi:flavodoxin